jgi:hypothetical protein
VKIQQEFSATVRHHVGAPLHFWFTVDSDEYGHWAPPPGLEHGDLRGVHQHVGIYTDNLNRGRQ